jgi:hypothetical protein
MKICRQCLIEKDLESFRIVNKYRLNKCKQCYNEDPKTIAARLANKVKTAAYDAARYEGNKERCVAYQAVYDEANKVKKAAYQKGYRKDNKEVIAARTAAYRKTHKVEKAAWRKDNKATVNAATAKRRSAKLNRTPKWTSETDLWMIKEIYDLAVLRTKLTGVKCQVDHIIPLQGELVSGLHVPSNLQVITAKENKIKKNKFEVSV